MAINTVGAAAEHRQAFAPDQVEHRGWIDAPQTQMRAARSRHRPDECRFAWWTSVPMLLIHALRCVIITPFGRDVVPLV